MLFVPVLSALIMGGHLTSTQGAITLRYQPPIGKKYSYQLVMKMSMAASASAPAMGMTMSADLSERALSRAGGITTVESKVSNGKVDVPANSPLAMMKDAMEKQMNNKTVSVRYDARHENKGVVGGAMDASFSNLQSMSFPVKPLSVGSSWTTNLDLSKAMGGGMSGQMAGAASGTIPVTYKLTGISTSGGHTVALIHVVMAGSANIKAAGQGVKLHLSGSGTSQIDVTTGVVLSTKLTSVNEINFGGMTMKQNSTQSMTLK